MRIAISEKIRKEVADRANHKCEFSFDLDHIVPIKHGGSSEIENLALACPHCNQHKGSDFATIVNAEVVRLFNPRIDNWQESFIVVKGEILSKSKIGEASIKIFRFNEPDRVILRQLLASIGRY